MDCLGEQVQVLLYSGLVEVTIIVQQLVGHVFIIECHERLPDTDGRLLASIPVSEFKPKKEARGLVIV